MFYTFFKIKFSVFLWNKTTKKSHALKYQPLLLFVHNILKSFESNFGVRKLKKTSTPELLSQPSDDDLVASSINVSPISTDSDYVLPPPNKKIRLSFPGDFGDEDMNCIENEWILLLEFVFFIEI